MQHSKIRAIVLLSSLPLYNLASPLAYKLQLASLSRIIYIVYILFQLRIVIS
jgi:hypothetical protein